MVDVTLRRARRKERTAREQTASAARIHTGLGWPVCQGALFFVATRGAPAAADEWWSRHLDCVPDDLTDAAGLRWHCRDSYVLAPPSRHGNDVASRWICGPAGRPLPDAVRLLEYLADASGEGRS